MNLNLYAAWIGFLLGCLAGAIPGLFFHGQTWLGGYASWPRRMIRLGHISFFGLGLLNLALALTSRALEPMPPPRWSGLLYLLGAGTMPLVCYLAAWKPAFRHLFFIPALSVTLGTALFTWRIMVL